jgi:ATP-binding cassette subfamily B (MDR/TAP) protein 1
VVVAYGQELKEQRNYNKYLDRARKAGVKTHLKGSLVLAMFMASIFATYSFSFYMGMVWIYNDIYNDTFDRMYKPGDILSCFFGVVFGMFSVGMATPNLKAVAEGKVAGKMAYDIIDREPQIKQDDPNAQHVTDLKGEIEFKDVSFYYPSRPDN